MWFNNFIKILFKIFLYLIILISPSVFAGTSKAQLYQKSDTITPEKFNLHFDISSLSGESYRLKKKSEPVIAKSWMVVTANRQASETAAKILNNGGTAIDAMISAQLVLGLVEPESSGLGGGAFLVYFDNILKKLTTLDGRETAPLKIKPNHFLDKKNHPFKFIEAVVGGKSVGVPGVVALLEKAHKKWGKIKWSELFTDGIELAENGFIISQKLSSSIKKNKNSLQKFEKTRDYFFPKGKGLKYGDLKKNTNYANTLKSLSRYGSSIFYAGSLGDDLIHTIKNAKQNPGILSKNDLITYQVIERRPVCSRYREYNVCGMGPPSSGAITIGQILGIIENYNIKDLGYHNPETWRIIGDATRLAFVDRNKYIADIDFVDVPINDLINKKYLRLRSKKLEKNKKLTNVKPGNFSMPSSNNFINYKSLELPSTSHISIIDKYGNALAMTSSIENSFGSRLMTNGGYLLNNQLTDFSFKSKLNGKKIANSVEPKKRPRSSMSPTIIFKNDKPKIIIGSPGGSNIISYVVNSIISLIDWELNVQETASLPHGVNKYGTFYLEKNSKIVSLKTDLERMGYNVKLKNFNSGLNIIHIKNKIFGGSDPRREGIAIGN